MVSMGDGNWQFFQGNTRRSRVFKLQTELGVAIGRVSGLVPLDLVALHSGVDSQRLVALADVLHAACLIEYAEVAKRIAQSPWRRVLNFICEFRPKLDTDSSATWTVIPTEAGQRFQGKLDSWKR